MTNTDCLCAFFSSSSFLEEKRRETAVGLVTSCCVAVRDPPDERLRRFHLSERVSGCCRC